METKSSEQRFALLIDADNVSAKYLKAIMDELSKYGAITYKRIYGDWTLSLHAKWKEALLENSITPIQQFGYTQGKNATDSAMIIDAMDILYTGSVDGFCIVSSDSDFTRLAARIREGGLTVIGMGEKKTPTPFRKACDIFTTLELLEREHNGQGRGAHGQGAAGKDDGPTTSRSEIEQAVVNIITANLNNGKQTGLGEIGSRLLKRYPDFDVRSYGTNLLSKLLDEFDRVKINKEGHNISVELADDKDHEDAPSPATGDGGEEEAGQKAPEAQDEAAPAEGEPDTGGEGAAEDKPHRSRRSRSRRRRGRRSHEGDQGAETQGEDGAGSEAAPAQTPRLSAPPTPKALPQPQEKTDEASTKGERPANDEPAEDARPGRAGRRAKAKTANKPAKKGVDKKTAGGARGAKTTDEQTPEGLIRSLIAEAGPGGIAVDELNRRVRAKFRAFKVRDLGFTQMKGYLASLDDVELERDGKALKARVR